MNYKDTLHLPKTDFPMKADLVTREPERLKIWEEQGLYERIQEVRKESPLFVLHDGPPFANGDVHMGTALNKVLKDLIVKSKAMAASTTPSPSVSYPAMTCTEYFVAPLTAFHSTAMASFVPWPSLSTRKWTRSVGAGR